jgi:hypothetical protein
VINKNETLRRRQFENLLPTYLVINGSQSLKPNYALKHVYVFSGLKVPSKMAKAKMESGRSRKFGQCRLWDNTKQLIREKINLIRTKFIFPPFREPVWIKKLCRLCTGLPDFSWSKHNKTEKNIPDDHKLYLIAIKHTKGP